MSEEKILIAPSILSADFSCLKDQVKMVEEAGADMMHLDVMDGNFVPNITIGPLVVEAVNRITELPLDVHLMIDKPSRYMEDFVKAGADYLSIHHEACTHFGEALMEIKELGAKAGAVINPETPVSILEEFLEIADYILIMSVNPGFGGQSFIPSSVQKLEELSGMLKQAGLERLVEIDGGIGPGNAETVVRAGARMLVAGASIYKQPDIRNALKDIRQAARNGLV